MPPFIRSCAAAVLFALAVPFTASAGHDASGGAAFSRPEVKQLRCSTGDRGACPRGEILRLGGEYLREARTVVFLGGRGRHDDRRARPHRKSPHRLLVRVPESARSGPVRVIGAYAASTRGPRLRVLRRPPAPPAAAQPAATEGVFPVRGKHHYGTETNRFGGGRNHQGQDVLAACGTPLVSALSGTVQWVKWHDAAGNYIVIQAADGTSQAYMHLQEPSPLRRGDRVVAGQPIGRVGTTGRSSACHLHFELWTAPGWYEGGEPIDPLPTLKRWDAADDRR